MIMWKVSEGSDDFNLAERKRQWSGPEYGVDRRLPNFSKL